MGQIYFLMNKPELSIINYDTARIHLQEKMEEQPDDPRIHSSLGIVYAMIGRKEEALREEKLGVDLYPIYKDAMIGLSRIEDLAQINAILGMHDEAIDHIEHLLSIPCLLSESFLKLQPKWDPLREHPRFKQLLEKSIQSVDLRGSDVLTAGELCALFPLLKITKSQTRSSNTFI